ncbi:2-keto-4-pentenoate hydratase [Streptomyces sp. NPDC002676]
MNARLHRQLADELLTARRKRRPVPRISTRHPELTLRDAYAVQAELRALESADGAVVVGYKIGATSEAIQRMFGIDQPDFGYLTDRMMLSDGCSVDAERFIAPKIEGELAFRLGENLAGDSVTAQDVLDATSEVMPALEICDSRIEHWDIGLVDTVADNASSGMAVLGPPVPLDGTDLAAEQMVFQAGEQVQAAYGSAVLGHPAQAVACLVRILAAYGTGISSGQVVLAGSWAGAVDLLPGTLVKASFGRLGSVSLTVNSPL